MHGPVGAHGLEFVRRRQPERDSQPILIVTTNDIPGYRIIRVQGDAFGLIVRARNYFSNLGAQLRTLAGGEVAGYTKLLTDSRNEARERMWREARACGANAVIGMRFDCNEIGGVMSEIAAYGTAVTVEPEQARAAEYHRQGADTVLSSAGEASSLVAYRGALQCSAADGWPSSRQTSECGSRAGPHAYANSLVRLQLTWTIGPRTGPGELARVSPDRLLTAVRVRGRPLLGR